MTTVRGRPAFERYTANPTPWVEESHDRFVGTLGSLTRTDGWLASLDVCDIDFDDHAPGTRSPTDIMLAIKTKNRLVRSLLKEAAKVMNEDTKCQSAASFRQTTEQGYVMLYRLRHLQLFLAILGVPARRLVDRVAGSVLVRIKTDATTEAESLLTPPTST